MFLARFSPSVNKLLSIRRQASFRETEAAAYACKLPSRLPLKVAPGFRFPAQATSRFGRFFTDAMKRLDITENFMNNTQQATNNELPTVGIIQTSYTVSVTFTDKPTAEQRAKLKSAGYLFDKGRWFRNQSSSDLATQASVDQLMAA
ncbi:hypothetical protein P12x_005331 [Tundrisphaera lichenicola]|uniref:hypothetical protein n=1 Tax=Tundrisphaera lichenicola TaxID=2029860 RepID=UPI003EBB8E03